MRMPNARRGDLIEVNTTYEAEGLEAKLRKMLESKEPIEEVCPTIYTDKKNGVMKEYDIRTDRFDVALEAMGKIREAELAQIAKREATAAAQSETAETKTNVRQEPS